MALALPACSQVPAAPEVRATAVVLQDMRVLVKAGPDTDGMVPELMAQRATSLAGVPVRHVAASGGGWHALVLGCAEPSLCEAGVARLRQNTASFTVVEVEARASRGPGQPASGAR